MIIFINPEYGYLFFAADQVKSETTTATAITTTTTTTTSTTATNTALSGPG